MEKTYCTLLIQFQQIEQEPQKHTHSLKMLQSKPYSLCNMTHRMDRAELLSEER